MAVLLIVAGLLLMMLGVFAWFRILPRNRFAGMRTKATLASDDAWVASQHASAWSMVLAGAVTFAAGIAMPTLLLPYAVVVVAIAVIGGIQANGVARRTAPPG